MTVYQSASLIVQELLPERASPALGMRRAAQQPRADLLVSPWPETREKEKFDRWKMLKCARDTGSRLLHQNEQGAEYSCGYQEGWASPYKYPWVICNPGKL